ncbi:MAG: hypothetical protein IJV37_05880, partial [Bacteroidales bacterium]|nr:hypothetical protein [Bacteroidales bacterium]
FSYDNNGNVTSDATNSLQTSYNLLNLPAQIKSGSSVKANYTYLSDGTKAGAYTSASAGKDYVGSFVYARGANGTRTLESVAFGGGRIRKSGSSYLVDYHVTDHLGSVRAIVTNGSIVEQDDYYPFGTRHSNGLTQLAANRWRFGGKEEQDGAFGIACSDFGARFLASGTASWTSIDPLAEKYYSVSPYAYCNNNPVKFVDPEGNNWYSYLDGDGSVRYKYIEGQLSNEQIQERGYTDLGYSFSTKDRYYSLFGIIIKADTEENKKASALYKLVDDFVIMHHTAELGENGEIPHMLFHIEGLPNGNYGFRYIGSSFESADGRNVYSEALRTVYRASNIENSRVYEKSWPSKQITIRDIAGGRQYSGYYIQAANNLGIYDGHRILQIRFDEKNASSFLRACYNLFGK